MNDHFTTIVSMGFDEAIAAITEELKKEAFGVLTEIAVKSTLKKKLDVDFRNSRILGLVHTPGTGTGKPYRHHATLQCHRAGTA